MYIIPFSSYLTLKSRLGVTQSSSSSSSRSRRGRSVAYDHAGWLLAIGQQVGADGPDGVGRSSGCEDDQSCGPNRGQVVYRLMPRSVVSVLGELECWVTFSPVVTGSGASFLVHLVCSVPQGSVLGPRMFIMYTADLP